MKKPVFIALATITVALAVVFGSQLRKPSPDPEDSVAQLAPIAVSPPVVDSTATPAQERPQSTDPAPPLVKPVKPPTERLPPAPVETSPKGEAQDSDAASVLKRAAAAYQNVRSMRADFTQWQDNPLLGRRTNSRGTVFQRQPDRFLMRFSQPEGDVIVSDGEYFWLYYPSVDAKQVLRSRATDVGGLDLQAQFIGDPTRRYSFTDQGSEDVGGRPARVLTLVPRQPVGYKSLKVWIDQRDHLVRRFELTMDNGVMQHFDLNNLQVNPTLANELFRFTPPAGARIIDR
jgi:outer membrane lipoprotein carrier protein